MSAYFVPLGDGRYVATEHTSGAWAESEQHISPMVGLLAHELEQRLPSGLLLSRLSVDILGVVGVEEFAISCSVLRGGRTIELVEAVSSWRGREVLRARAWRLAAIDTSSVAGGDADPMPAHDELPPWEMTSVWPGGYIASLDVRRAADARPGRARAWVSSPVDLVEGEPVSDLARFLMLVDTANGLSVRQSPREWLFPNVDLTVHLHRQPVGGPVGFDTTVVFGSTGHGLTHSTLHDAAGQVGHASQVLTVRPRG